MGKSNQVVKAFGKRLIFRPYRIIKHAQMLDKSHVKAYRRHSKTGKLIQVKPYNARRKMSLKQADYIQVLTGFTQFSEIKKEFLKHFDPESGKTDITSRTASRLINVLNNYWVNPNKSKNELLKIQRQF